MSFKPNVQTQSLLNVVNRFFPGKVTVQFIGHQKSGFVRSDQAQTVQDGKNIFIQINDESAPNYTASHELLHLLMILRGFPQVFFSLTTGNHTLDVQLKAMGLELYDIISHFVVVSEQRKHHLITSDVEKMYMKGIYASIKPEPKDKIDNEMEVRLATLLDAIIFYGKLYPIVRTRLLKDYPVSLKAAEHLYRVVTEKPTDSPFGFRRNVVKLFKAYDAQLKKWGLPPLQNTAFTTVSSVLSIRQLNLQVHQLFNIYHSELNDSNTGRRAYVGFSKTDGQNSFVIPEPLDKQKREKFIPHLYGQTVKDLFKKIKMPFIVR